MKILVAEDEPDILTFYKVLLEHEGHQVVSTKNGDECLDEYNKNRDLDGGFGLVILDYRMPGKNGMEVAREIVRMVPSQTLLMVTAFSGVLEMEEKPVDMNILPKPFDPDQLVQAVNRLLSSQEAA